MMPLLGDMRLRAAVIACVAMTQLASAASVWPSGSVVMLSGGKELTAYTTKGKKLPGSINLQAAALGLSSIRKSAISPDGKFAFNMATAKSSSGTTEKLIVTAIGSTGTKIAGVVSHSLPTFDSGHPCASGNPFSKQTQLDVAIGKAFPNGSYPVASYFACALSAATYGSGCAGTYLSLCNYKPGGALTNCAIQGLDFDFSCSKETDNPHAAVAVPYDLSYVDGSFFLSGEYSGGGGGKPHVWQLLRATGAFPYSFQVAATLNPWSSCPAGGVTAIQSTGTPGSTQNAAFFVSCFQNGQTVKHTTGNNKVSTFRRPAASGRGYAAIATQSPTAPLVILDAALDGKSPSKVVFVNKATRSSTFSFAVAADVSNPIAVP